MSQNNGQEKARVFTPEMMQSMQLVLDAALKHGGIRIKPHVDVIEAFFSQPNNVAKKEHKPDLDKQPKGS